MEKHKPSYKSKLQVSKISLSFLTCCVIGLLALNIIGIQAPIANSQTLSQQLTLDLSQVSPVNSLVGTDTDFFLSPEDPSNEAVWSAVADIGIPVLRFPGGEGDWYDWKTGAIPSSGPGPETFGVREKPQTKNVALDAFISHARNVNASVTYVLNILDSPESIQNLALHWQETNAPVQWVELGNEYYLSSQVIGGATGYLQHARQAVQALRAGNFKGPVGIGLAPVGAPGAPQFDFGAQWNQELAMANTQDFDAVILHYYPWVQTVGFETDYQKGPAGLIATVKTAQKQFAGKQIWLTEWNLGPPVDVPEFNSLVHAMFDLRMLQAILDSGIDMSCYHVLTGIGWELLGPDQLTLSYSSSTHMLRRVPFFAFKELLQAKKNGAYLAKQTPINEFEYMAFLKNSEINIVAWTRNNISTTIAINLPGYTTQFLGGEALQGQLLDNNGSFLSKNSGSIPWTEKIVPTAIHTPVLSGSGIVLLRFSFVP